MGVGIKDEGVSNVLRCSSTVTDVSIKPAGMVWAVASIITSGLQQVYCGQMQRKHKISSNDLLSKSAMPQVSHHVC